MGAEGEARPSQLTRNAVCILPGRLMTGVEGCARAIIRCLQGLEGLGGIVAVEPIAEVAGHGWRSCIGNGWGTRQVEREKLLLRGDGTY